MLCSALLRGERPSKVCLRIIKKKGGGGRPGPTHVYEEWEEKEEVGEEDDDGPTRQLSHCSLTTWLRKLGGSPVQRATQRGDVAAQHSRGS